MGVNQSCHLYRMSDLCDMHTCIAHISGSASDRESQTDTWICTLKEGTFYENKKVTHTAMKIGINPSSLPVENAKRAAIGLMYELQVYNQLITPILDAFICPNFVRSYLVSYNCRRADLVMALSAGIGVEPSQASRHLDRSLGFLQQGRGERPPVDAPVPPGERYLPPSDNLRLMVLTTEYTDLQTYKDWLMVPHSVESVRVVLLQIVVALHVMALSKLMHNDLCAQSIFVQTTKKPETVTYRIQGVPPITYSSCYRVKIMGFDKATTRVLGENALFTRSARFQNLPTFEKKRDLVCLFKNLETLADKVGTPLSRLSGIPEFFDTAGVRDTEWYQSRGDEIPTTLLTGLRSIAATLPAAGPPDGSVFTVTRDMFMRDGSLNCDHQVLADLKISNAQYETEIIRVNAYLERCKIAVREYEAELAGGENKGLPSTTVRSGSKSRPESRSKKRTARA